MKAKSHDPLTALSKRAPEIVQFITKETRDAFQRHAGVKATPMALSIIEGELTRVFAAAQQLGADLPDHTVVALKFDAARRMQVSTVWHIKPWWSPLEACCIHLGSTGTVTSPEHTRPVDLWRCIETGDTHIVWGESLDERATLPLYHVPQVITHLHDEDERSIQVAIAERVCQKRPEIMQRRPKRMM